MPDPDPGVTTPPVAPDGGNPPAPVDPPAGSEPVTNSDGKPEQTVPFTRFQEVNDKAKTAEDRAAQLESELESLKEQQTQAPQSSEEEIEPDTLDLVKRANAKLGYVSKEELDAREAQIQVRQDIQDLTSQYKESGIPFDGKKVIDYAKTNGMPIASKQSLDAVYQYMNRDSIIEAQRKAAVADFQQGAKAGAEKPGSGGAKAPQESKPGNLRDRIKAARENANVSIA